MANQTIFTGCGWEQLDFDTDGLPNGQDPDPYEFFIGDLAQIQLELANLPRLNGN